jgi:hypothetical protein
LLKIKNDWMKRVDTFFEKNPRRKFFRCTVDINELPELRDLVCVVGATTQTREEWSATGTFQRVEGATAVNCLVIRADTAGGDDRPMVFLLDGVPPAPVNEAGEEASPEEEQFCQELWKSVMFAEALGMSLRDFVAAAPSLGFVEV